jgi:hypothetical protein
MRCCRRYCKRRIGGRRCYRRYCSRRCCNIGDPVGDLVGSVVDGGWFNDFLWFNFILFFFVGFGIESQLVKELWVCQLVKQL